MQTIKQSDWTSLSRFFRFTVSMLLLRGLLIAAEGARMIFTKLARMITIVGFVNGLSNALLGLATATELIGSYEAALARYTSRSSSWQLIDRAKTILAAAELSPLAEW